MTDRYAKIRQALDAGPTPGPWKVRKCPQVALYNGKISDGWKVEGPQEVPDYEDTYYTEANATHIAACDPDTIAELLGERDVLHTLLGTVADMVANGQTLDDYWLAAVKQVLGEEDGYS